VRSLLAGFTFTAATTVFATAPASAAAGTVVTFSSPGCTTWPIPAGVVSAIEALAVGAAGQPDPSVTTSGGSGGPGDAVGAELSGLSFGEDLRVCVDVGGGGAPAEVGGTPGGAGGGASGVGLGLTFSRPLLVAGGGGGGGMDPVGSNSAGGAAGNPASPGQGSSLLDAVPGGGGGGPSAPGAGGAAADPGGVAGTPGTASSAAGPGEGGAGGTAPGSLGFGGGGGGGGDEGGGGGGSGGGSSDGGGGGADYCSDGITGTVTVRDCTVDAGTGTGTVAGTSPGDAVVTLSYTPAAAPMVTISAPTATSYAMGAIVRSSFTCTEGAGGPGLSSCTDQAGQPSGTLLDTGTPGAHVLRVTATSRDGLTATATVTYVVEAPPPPPPPPPPPSPPTTTPTTTPPPVTTPTSAPPSAPPSPGTGGPGEKGLHEVVQEPLGTTRLGASVDLAAGVTTAGGAAVRAGGVTFAVGRTILCTAAVTDGVATCATARFPRAGWLVIVGRYARGVDGGRVVSRRAVRVARESVQLRAVAVPVGAQRDRYLARVRRAGGPFGPPRGAVTFLADGEGICAARVERGVAACTGRAARVPVVARYRPGHDYRPARGTIARRFQRP
jgi:hypothetical protein